MIFFVVVVGRILCNKPLERIIGIDVSVSFLSEIGPPTPLNNRSRKKSINYNVVKCAFIIMCICIWNIHSQRGVVELERKYEWVSCVCVTSDGRINREKRKRKWAKRFFFYSKKVFPTASMHRTFKCPMEFCSILVFKWELFIVNIILSTSKLNHSSE